MPKTIKLPGIGPVKQEYLMLAGTGVVGVVGYMYWKQRNAPVADTFGTGVEPGPGLIENTPQFGSSGPAGLYGQQPDDNMDPRPGHFLTNSEWFQYAVDYLASRMGIAEGDAGTALSKYLDRKQLTTVEIGHVQKAVAAAGPPPQNGPFSILPVTGTTNPPPTGTSAPGPVRNLMASTSRTQMLARWNHPNTGARATKFRVEFYGGKPGGGTFTVSAYTTTRTDQKSSPNLKPAHSYGVRVAAIGADGKQGPWQSVVRTTDR